MKDAVDGFVGASESVLRVWRTAWGFVYIYIFYISTSNLGFEIAVRGQEREQGRFRGSSERVQGSIGGSRGEHLGSKREHDEAIQGRSR